MKHGGNLSGGSLLQHLRTFSSGEKRPEMGHISCLRTKKPMLRLGPLPFLKSGRRALSARARGFPSPCGCPEFL